MGSTCPIRQRTSVHIMLHVMLRIISTSDNISANSIFPTKAHAIIPNRWHFQLHTGCQPTSQWSCFKAPWRARPRLHSNNIPLTPYWNRNGAQSPTCRHTCACCHVDCLAALRSPRASNPIQTESENWAHKADLDKLHHLPAIARRKGFAAGFQVNLGHTGDHGLFAG
jgi:hypothetical protein